MTTSLLLCYDGSPHAASAIRDAAKLFPGARADVLAVVEITVALVAAARYEPTLVPRIEDAARSEGHQQADEGVEIAREAGFDARPIGKPATQPIWAEIVSVAEAGGYAVIVVGSRGRSGIAKAILGSVSSAVVSHSQLPVLVMPSRE